MNHDARTAKPSASNTVAVSLLAVLSFGLLCAAALGQQPAQASKSYSELGSYFLKLDGERAPSRFFHSAALGTILIEIPQLGKLVELNPRSRSVQAFLPEHFSVNPNNTWDRLTTAKPVLTTKFEIIETLPSFEIDGHKAQVVPKPDMLGEYDRAKLITANPGYGARAALYRPFDYHLDRIKTVIQPMVVKVFFGSWCAVCFNKLPNMVRVEEALADAPVEFQYYGLPRGFDDPEAKRSGVNSVPTAIVYVGGVEIGRIKGSGFSYPDMSIANMLSGIPSHTFGKKPGS